MRHFTNDNLEIEFDLGEQTVISDPCYSELGDSCTMVVRTKPGRWIARVNISDEGLWGKRVQSLVAETLGARMYHTDPGDVCVDSGQMSIVDLDYYEGDNEGFGDESTFYGDACALTLAEGAFGGLLKSGHGVVSSSGFGDGGYRVALGWNGDDQVVAIMVVFIENEDFDDEDDWEDEGDYDY